MPSDRTAKALGIRTQKQFTTPDGLTFDQYSKAMAHTNYVRRVQRIEAFCQEYHASTETTNFILRRIKELKEIL